MKEVKEERLTIILSLEREGGTAPVTVTGRADYTVTSDDLEVVRSLDFELTSAQETAIKTFAAKVLADIKEAEGVS